MANTTFPIFRVSNNGKLLDHINVAFLRRTCADPAWLEQDHLELNNTAYHIIWNDMDIDAMDKVIISFQQWKDGRNFAVIKKDISSN